MKCSLPNTVGTQTFLTEELLTLGNEKLRISHFWFWVKRNCLNLLVMSSNLKHPYSNSPGSMKLLKLHVKFFSVFILRKVESIAFIRFSRGIVRKMKLTYVTIISLVKKNKYKVK